MALVIIQKPIHKITAGVVNFIKSKRPFFDGKEQMEYLVNHDEMKSKCRLMTTF
ncbi:hypothetical protein [Pseudobacteriovorax antillogorgiicola]|uniref:Uncharacterized protein n=1 Tax=Pseudobacteriovorax antillogorgiicola TaxID=1513793 RepID=A0A1Y6CDT8_9BACT|nr:hypothetical protein [Pseudobacteriovorax antillogorgiicola]TCS48014.1 hypothetical protein EDD56_119125 [Pseudobacteriovorax antillogorgiicola]SMF58567.1 hypothetical protein SAMN06296036_119126 [Pseudobacteriovorax antillogorgiicola]